MHAISNRWRDSAEIVFARVLGGDECMRLCLAVNVSPIVFQYFGHQRGHGLRICDKVTEYFFSVAVVTEFNALFCV